MPYANPEDLREQKRRFYKKHRERLLKKNAEYRLRRLAARAGIPKVCALCGETQAKFHLDHIIPRSRGGSDDASNRQWLCATCNLAKGALTPDEFISHIRKILARIQ